MRPVPAAGQGRAAQQCGPVVERHRPGRPGAGDGRGERNRRPRRRRVERTGERRHGWRRLDDVRERARRTRQVVPVTCIARGDRSRPSGQRRCRQGRRRTRQRSAAEHRGAVHERHGPGWSEARHRGREGDRLAEDGGIQRARQRDAGGRPIDRRGRRCAVVAGRGVGRGASRWPPPRSVRRAAARSAPSTPAPRPPPVSPADR